MEFLFSILQAGAFFLALFAFWKIVTEVASLFRGVVNSESTKFAHNTLHNHARVSGITQSGKITHHKYSCGGDGIMTNALGDDPESIKNRLIIVSKKNKNPEDSIIFSFVPQTRLHGGGWFSGSKA